MSNRRGFSMIEMVIVVMVGAILLSVAMTAFGQVRGRLAVREARQTLAALHARTRAQAIEFGQTTILNLDATGDSMWISRNDTTLEAVRLRNEIGVDLRAGAATYSLCMNPRGYGQESCSSFSSIVTLEFWAGEDSSTVKMYPLGQLVY